MSEKCVNDFMGFCHPYGEYAVISCKFQGPHIEETYDWHYVENEQGRREYVPDKYVVKLIVNYDIPYCWAKPSDLVEFFEECWYCDGTPEYDPDEPDYCFCPVDYPEECPRKIIVDGEQR